MVCIKCGSRTKVVNSRLQKRSNQIWRRRLCNNCSFIFTSEEFIDFSTVWRVKEDSATNYAYFYRDKLYLSIYKSLKHRNDAFLDATELCHLVMRLLEKLATNGILTDKDIALTIASVFDNFDKAASSHYRAYHPKYF